MQAAQRASEAAIPKRAPSLLGAFRYKDFRLLWGGLLISNLGSWMQITAMSFLVVQSAGSPRLGSLYVGLVTGARVFPVLLCSPIAGVLADTVPRRRLLFATNIAMSFIALALAILATLGRTNLWALIVISVLNGAAQSFDTPARQSWVPIMVDREYVGNAIGLNSVAFNAPSVIGPVIAGYLINVVGVAGSFYVNAVATLAVVAALIFMTPVPPSYRTREPMWASIRAGLKFLNEHAILRYVVGFFILSALLVRPYSLLLPAYALNYMHTDATGMGLALGAVGVGAFGGALATTVLASRESRARPWFIASAIMCAGVCVLGFVHHLYASFPILFLIGLATMTFMGMSNTLIQMLSPDQVRGRAISVYSMIALGLVPGGALLIGSLGALIGLHLAFMLAGAIAALALLWLYLTKPILRTV